MGVTRRACAIPNFPDLYVQTGVTAPLAAFSTRERAKYLPTRHRIDAARAG
jgi:hypothetical protein